MESLENLSDLFIHELRDLYDAEMQLTKALPLMAQAAQADELKRAFDEHLQITKEQATRIQEIFRALGESAEGKTCKAMAGLIAEAKEMLDEDADPEVLDAALIVAAQKIEHYEIAGYGSVRSFARALNYGDAARLLDKTLTEEARTDERLTAIADRLNERARTADQARN
jgi:ferritin-like metal-binding protein YciE